MERDVLIKVKNRGNGLVGYNVDELGVRRLFYPGETKEITFNELVSFFNERNVNQ